jgi:hypothetical protein
VSAAGPDADAEFLRAFDAGEVPGDAFGHRAHLRLAWALIERDGVAAAAPGIERRLRRLAAAHGMPERYNSTLTLFWVRLIAHGAAARPVATFAELAAAEPWLLDTGLVRRHDSQELLASEPARAAWVDPDLIAMPG